MGYSDVCFKTNIKNTSRYPMGTKIKCHQGSSPTKIFINIEIYIKWELQYADIESVSVQTDRAPLASVWDEIPNSGPGLS